MLENKFKNYGLWVSLIALVPIVCKGFGVDILPNNYNEITTALLGILVAAGVISSPDNGKWYTDAKESTPTDITNDIKK